MPDRRAIDFESLVGRYGTLGLASLTILMGAGAFLSWAIAQGKIGALGAAAVAVAGWRLRAKGSMRFGSTLLALALALVHVDAWGAGPYLKIVPPSVALGVAAIASLALAALAWYGDEEALFSVGVGGAVLAPFRLRDVTLAWNVPDGYTSRIGADRLKVYLTGRNLWTKTGWHGLDPELDAQRSIPLEKTYVGGLSVTF